MELVMLVPGTTNVKKLRSALEDLGDGLNCDIDLDPA